MNKLKGILPTSLLTIVAFFSQASAGLAQTFNSLTEVPAIQQSTAGDLSTVIANLGGWLLGIAGGIAVLYLIYGGITYITGGEKGAEKGKTIIVNAIIGIAVVALATVIANAVITVVG